MEKEKNLAETEKKPSQKMGVTWKFKKETLGAFAIAMVIAFLLFLETGYSLPIFFLFGACYLLIKNLKINLNEKLPWIWTLTMFAISSVMTAYLVQYLLLDAELREKITDDKMFLNVLCCLAVYFFVQIFTNNTGLTCIISYIFLMVLAGINYFVYMFRGNELIFSDIKSVQTGLSVASNYQFELDDRAGYVILISILYVAFIRKLHVRFQKRWLEIPVLITVVILLGVYVGSETEYTVTETWEQKGSYRNGYLLNFVLSVRDSFVTAPEGYSEEAVATLEEQYQGDGSEYVDDVEENPTIIVVMSESYADLSVVGDFSTNHEVTPFYDSLEENCIKGYALSSVFGAKTPNSEWEFMTGNSMAFLPSGSVVYQQYISEEPTSIVSNLKNIGYTCVAMHPYYETGWSRNSVYPDLGFDEMHFIDDFDQNAILREYITDQELYEKIIERYESKASNEDLFIMSISMQNHGGYTDTYANFNQKIRMTGLNYPDVNQYLSLLNESDSALEYLITYFENVEEPVEIVFFGDHQPSLSSSFYPNLNGKGLSGLTEDELEDLYTVPFFIWTNYESEEENIPITSINYLSTLALERAGIELPAYNQFLADMMEHIPAINARGYYSLTKGGFLHVEDATGEEAEWISKYQILQYNNMFGKKKTSKLFFPYFNVE